MDLYNSTELSEQLLARSVVDLLWRNKLRFALTSIAVLALTVVYLITAERLFESRASLYLGSELQPTGNTSLTDRKGISEEPKEREVNALVELLNSRLIAEMAVDQFGTDVILDRKDGESAGLKTQIRKQLDLLNDYNLNPLQVYSLRDKAIEQFQDDFHVMAMKSASVISMEYQYPDPTRAREILEFVVHSVMDENHRVHRKQGSQQFFVSQSELLRKDLSQLESELRDLKNQSGLASLDVQRQIQLNLAGQLKEELITYTAEQRAIHAEVQLRETQLQSIEEKVVTLETTDKAQAIGQALREKIYDLEARERKLTAQFTENNPILQQHRELLADAQKIAESESERPEQTLGINPNYQASELALNEKQAALVAVEARIESLRAELDASEIETKRINDAELQVRQLEREIELARDNYLRYADSYEEARIFEQLHEARISSLTVMQPPTFSNTPVSPSALKTMVLGFVLACAAGVAMAFTGKSGSKRLDSEKSSSSENPGTVSLSERSRNKPAREQPAAIEGVRRTPITPTNPR